MNVIAIYHHPQECGDPYLTIISQVNGQIIETIDIPDGYSWSGHKLVDKLTPVEHFTEEYCRLLKPRKGYTVPAAHYKANPNHYEYVVTKVTNLRHNTDGGFPAWLATLHVDACKKETISSYSIEDDTFLHRMEENGFDMTHWTLPDRQKIEFKEFLWKLVEGYKDYHLINLIEIG